MVSGNKCVTTHCTTTSSCTLPLRGIDARIAAGLKETPDAPVAAERGSFSKPLAPEGRSPCVEANNAAWSNSARRQSAAYVEHSLGGRRDSTALRRRSSDSSCLAASASVSVSASASASELACACVCDTPARPTLSVSTNAVAKRRLHSDTSQEPVPVGSAPSTALTVPGGGRRNDKNRGMAASQS